MNKQTILIALGAGLLGMAVGSVSTYLTVKKHFEKQMNDAIEEIRNHYRLVRKEEDFFVTLGEEVVNQALVTEQIKAAQTVIQNAGYLPTPTEEELTSKKILDSIEQRRNVFDPPEDAFEVEEVDPGLREDTGYELPEDYSIEKDKPYLITVEEFLDNNPGHEQATITWFEDDDTLLGEDEEIIQDIDGIIGRRHLDMFGVKSRDAQIVYVRNENIEVDFEIIRREGSFVAAMYGLDEDQFDSPSKLKKMRDDD